MRLTYKDKASIKLVRQQKGWGAKHICKEFPNKNWAVSCVKDLLCKIDKDELDFSKGLQWTESDCPNNTEYRACSGADMQPGRQPWVQQKSERFRSRQEYPAPLYDGLPFVFHHCDIMLLECFDSIVLFVNNILTYSLGFGINMCRADYQFIWYVILSI